MEKPKVLFANQEIFPYTAETPMSKIGRYLPQIIQEQGKEIRTFMPRFGVINERRHQLHEVIRLSGMNLVINDTDHPLIIKVASIQSARMQVYFIDNEEYFYKKDIFFDKNNHPYPDLDEKAIFFARGVIETIKKLNWSPDLIFCNGWYTTFLPFYIKKRHKDNPLFSHSKIVTHFAAEKLQENIDKNIASKLKFDGFAPKDYKAYGDFSYDDLMQLSIDYSDGLCFSSNGDLKDSVVERIRSSQKPVLEYEDEKYKESMNDFFDQILAR